MPNDGQKRGIPNNPFSDLSEVLLKKTVESLPSNEGPERTFYEHLARVKSGALQTQLNDLCAAWCRCMCCEWVWLWQFNGHSGRWELFGFAGKNGNHPPLPINMALMDSNSVTEFTAQTGQPEFVDNPAKWTKQLGTQTYFVSSAPFLTEKGCKAFISIPLLPPVNGKQGEERQANHVICCHYHDKSTLRNHPADVLALKGKITYHFITSAFDSHEHRILCKLNELAGPYIRAQHIDPRKNRHEYATKLRDLISDELHIPHVSIFFEDSSGTLLECIATTGLFDAHNHWFDNEQVDRIHYNRGSSRTWQVHETGKPLVVSIGEVSPEASKYQEIRFGSVDHKMPWAIQPLPLMGASPHERKDPKSAGVIRCTGHPVPSQPAAHRNFLPSELQSLGQIAQQSTLVLQALSVSVFREIQVGSVKHDLLAPALMVRDASAAAQRPISELKALLGELRLPTDLQIAVNAPLDILENHIKDVNKAGFLSLLLLTELDSDPLQKIVLHPEETALVGDIIAPMSATLRHYAKETRKMTLEFGNFDTIPRLTIDRFQIWRALGNLVVNAVKYGTRGSKVSVELIRLRERRAIALSVINYGMGISEDDKERIFSGNYRAPGAQQIANGEGWGLKIVQRIMRLHQGEVEVTNLKNPTIFSLIFPWSLVTEK